MSKARRAGILVSMATFLGAMAGCGGGAGTAPTVRMYGEGEAPYSSSPPPAASAVAQAEPSAASKARDKETREESPREQPGLGTEWGETRRSQISMVSFERADARSPFATAALFYNDAEGASAATGGSWKAEWDLFDVGGGLVKVGLRDESGRLCPGFQAGKRNVVVGQAGHRYVIMLHNNTDRRVEVVLSVDGLDVLDGKQASFDKRGYILDARGDLEIDGFRQSMDTVAAFRFGSVRGSYASQRHGDTRNVGVIGVALFQEKGVMPFAWTAEEVRRRNDANPFPGEWATPPAL